MATGKTPPALSVGQVVRDVTSTDPRLLLYQLAAAIAAYAIAAGPMIWFRWFPARTTDALPFFLQYGAVFQPRAMDWILAFTAFILAAGLSSRIAAGDPRSRPPGRPDLLAAIRGLLPSLAGAGVTAAAALIGLALVIAALQGWIMDRLFNLLSEGVFVTLLVAGTAFYLLVIPIVAADRPGFRASAGLAVKRAFDLAAGQFWRLAALVLIWLATTITLGFAVHEAGRQIARHALAPSDTDALLLLQVSSYCLWLSISAVLFGSIGAACLRQRARPDEHARVHAVANVFN